VIENCKIAEAGTHDELLAKGGLYATLVEKQALREQLEAI
jgi:ABC-type multidrug transport system fused ATPase/permease subunit